ncbi:hypothetical protein LT966_21970 [Streptomyces griseobrunneus]
MPDVQGRCPACSAASLFLGEGGHVTCARIECSDPCAADQLLHGEAAAPRRAGDVLAALGRRIPKTFAKGIDRDDYALAPASEPPVVATARIALDVAVTPSDYALARAAAKPSAARDLAELQRRAARVTRKTDATVTVAPYGDGYEVTITRAGGTTRHGGYGFHAVQGILLGVAAAADYRKEPTPATEEAPDA